MSAVLVTGGAGYVGSHVVRQLLDAGHTVVVLDDLSRGHREAVAGVPLIEGDYGDAPLLDRIFGEHRIAHVVHLAAASEVGASMREPSAYYRNNVCKAPELLDAAVRHRVRGFVFSSTAAVYGDGDDAPLAEDAPIAPSSTYGETKLAFERMLGAYAAAHGLRWIALRYFNAAGAAPDGTIGEDHSPETHLIPRLLREAANGTPCATIYGDDYPTPDGTCIRDYVHVVDLADAHVRALSAFERGVAGPLNLGSGAGSSVREIVAAVERATGVRFDRQVAPRRTGDPAVLIADGSRARSMIGWRPERSAIDTIVADAWRWHTAHPAGFARAQALS